MRPEYPVSAQIYVPRPRLRLRDFNSNDEKALGWGALKRRSPKTPGPNDVKDLDHSNK